MFGVFPASVFTIHRGLLGGRGLSPRLWSKVAGQSVSPDGNSNAYFFGDDFLNFGQVAPSSGGTATHPAHGGYGVYVDTTTAACSVTQLGNEVGGAIRLATSAQDNYDAIITSGGNSGAIAVINPSNSPKKLIFEARVRLGQIGNNYNFFVGLSEPGCAATDAVFTDAGAMADKDRLGFWVTEADGDSLKFGYRKAGGALQTVLSWPTALVAAQWVKVGLIFDPAAPSTRRIEAYINNEQQQTFVTASDISASTFPAGEYLSLLAGLKNGEAAAKTADLDWWAVYQEG